LRENTIKVQKSCQHLLGGITTILNVGVAVKTMAVLPLHSLIYSVIKRSSISTDRKSFVAILKLPIGNDEFFLCLQPIKEGLQSIIV
jgi:hypothetical protein